MFIRGLLLSPSRDPAPRVRDAPDPERDPGSPEDVQKNMRVLPLGRGRWHGLTGGPCEPEETYAVPDRHSRDPHRAADGHSGTPGDRLDGPLLIPEGDQLDDAGALGSVAEFVLDHLAGELDTPQDEDLFFPGAVGGVLRQRRRVQELCVELLHRVEPAFASLSRDSMCGGKIPGELAARRHEEAADPTRRRDPSARRALQSREG